MGICTKNFVLIFFENRNLLENFHYYYLFVPFPDRSEARLWELTQGSEGGATTAEGNEPLIKVPTPNHDQDIWNIEKENRSKPDPIFKCFAPP